MAGKRMLHSNICESEKLSKISFAAETLYYRLLTKADDDGNFTANPKIVLGQCMPLRENFTFSHVEVLLEELSTITNGDKQPLISFYISGSEKYLHINRFQDFQYLRPDRTAVATCPTHPENIEPSILSQRQQDGLPVAIQNPPTAATAFMKKIPIGLGIIYLIRAEEAEDFGYKGYIGKSDNVNMGRTESHLRGSYEGTKDLIQEIVNSGFTPKSEILSYYPIEELIDKEKWWYEELTKKGWNLINRKSLSGFGGLPPSAQIKSNQTKSNLNQYNFKNIAVRFRKAFGRNLPHDKLQKDGYAQACGEFGEEAVLYQFETWQAENQWLRDEKYKSGLKKFYEQLSELIEVDNEIKSQEQEVEKQTDQKIRDEEYSIQAAQKESARQRQEILDSISENEEAARRLAENPEGLFGG